MIVNITADLANKQSVTYKGFQMSTADIALLNGRPDPARLGTSGFWKYVLTALNPAQAIIVRNKVNDYERDKAIITTADKIVVDTLQQQAAAAAATDQATRDAEYISRNYVPATAATVAAYRAPAAAPAKKSSAAAFLVPAAAIAAAGFFL